MGRRYKFLRIKHIRRDLSTILIEGLPCNTTKLKKRLFREGVKEYRCEKCGISEWNNEPITLELHHINGNHNDNHLENLQILCPNCHSQTVSFVGKKKNINDDNAIAELLEREKRRKEEILTNKYYWGELRKTTPKPHKKCLICGKEFKGRGEKYCSKECANKATVGGHIVSENYPEGYIVPLCDSCNQSDEPFQVLYGSLFVSADFSVTCKTKKEKK